MLWFGGIEVFEEEVEDVGVFDVFGSGVIELVFDADLLEFFDEAESEVGGVGRVFGGLAEGGDGVVEEVDGRVVGGGEVIGREGFDLGEELVALVDEGLHAGK